VSFDRRCAELARVFLLDVGLATPANIAEVAQEIQWVLEAAIERIEAEERHGSPDT